MEEVKKIETMVNSTDCLGCFVIFDGISKAAEVSGAKVQEIMNQMKRSQIFDKHVDIVKITRILIYTTGTGTVVLD